MALCPSTSPLRPRQSIAVVHTPAPLTTYRPLHGSSSVFLSPSLTSYLAPCCTSVPLCSSIDRQCVACRSRSRTLYPVWYWSSLLPYLNRAELHTSVAARQEHDRGSLICSGWAGFLSLVFAPASQSLWESKSNRNQMQEKPLSRSRHHQGGANL